MQYDVRCSVVEAHHQRFCSMDQAHHQHEGGTSSVPKLVYSTDEGTQYRGGTPSVGTRV